MTGFHVEYKASPKNWVVSIYLVTKCDAIMDDASAKELDNDDEKK